MIRTCSLVHILRVEWSRNTHFICFGIFHLFHSWTSVSFEKANKGFIRCIRCKKRFQIALSNFIDSEVDSILLYIISDLFLQIITKQRIKLKHSCLDCCSVIYTSRFLSLWHFLHFFHICLSNTDHVNSSLNLSSATWGSTRHLNNYIPVKHIYSNRYDNTNIWISCKLDI